MQKTEETLDVLRNFSELAVGFQRAIDENSSSLKFVFLTVVASDGLKPETFADPGGVYEVSLTLS